MVLRVEGGLKGLFVILKNYSSESQLLHNVVIEMQRQCAHHEAAPEGATATDLILG